jgi:glycosyltransferase involved in cell wall biosynthesis
MNDSTAKSSPRLGIIISMFPELHETFILRELVALEQRGLDFDIYSLQYPRDPITIDDAIRLSQERTHYGRMLSIDSLKALLKTIARHPLRLLKTIGTLIWQGRDRPLEVVKNLAILPLSLHFGELGAKRGTTHWHGHWANIPTTACWYLQQLQDQTWSAAIHGEDIFSPNRFLRHKLDMASFTVVCSGYFCTHLQTGIGLAEPGQVHLNYHGLDPRVMKRAAERRFKARSEDGVVRLVSIGRLVPTKGHDMLLKACGVLKREHGITFELQLIGSGPADAELRLLAGQEDVIDEVVFRGGIAFDEVLATLEQADVFCLAPRLIAGHPPDGIPNVIAEAMALRIPVVSTRISAIPELVEDGKTGRLVEVDDVPGMANAIREIAANAHLAHQMSDQAYIKVGSLFNQQRNIDELLGYFQQYVPGKVVA